jgi:peptide/nickel transport system substrate-binding protein
MRIFNAGLVLHNDRGLPSPYLAESIPQLGTDSWRVLPDGRMETTYRLRSGLTWHDGTPLVGDDFVFAFRVYGHPELGLATVPPMNVLESVEAPDARTVIFRWKQTYALADDLQAADFLPLPRHILEAPFSENEPDAFVGNPFWLTEYVGLGPYRLQRVELGTFVEGQAFDGHALGRPKIDTVRLMGIPDGNTVLANLLSGTVHTATDNSMDLQQAVVLEREWSGRTGADGGEVIRNPIGVRYTEFQARAEYAKPRAILDPRVRKAFAHSTDRQALADGTHEGLSGPADAIVLRGVEYYEALDRVLTKYPFDTRRANQLLNEAGWSPGSDGIYTSASEGRLEIELRTVQGARNEAELAIMADGLRKAGVDATTRALTRAERTNDTRLATLFPGIFNGHNTSASEVPLRNVRSEEVPREENRWRGSNRGGFQNAEVDRLVQAFETTLDRAQRNQHAVEMMRLLNEELPFYALYYSLHFLPRVGNLEGPITSVSSDVAIWNIHEWRWTS